MHGAYCAFIERDFYCHQGATMGEDMPGNALSHILLHRITGVSLDIENYCTLRLFFNLLDFGWSQPTKLTGSRYLVTFPDIIACQIDVLPA